MSGPLQKLEERLKQNIKEKLEVEAAPIVAEIRKLHENLAKLNKNIETLIETLKEEGKWRKN